MNDPDSSSPESQQALWFFPSVSSVKTNYSMLQYVSLLNAVGAERYLVSAYDLARASSEDRVRVEAALREARSRGCDVLMDCGNYESYWKADRSWDRDAFHAVAGSTDWAIAFSFDKQSLPEQLEAIVEEVVAGALRDRDALPGRRVCPIIHGAPELLPEACAAVAQKLKPEMVAVPERELGDGIYARAVTVWRIRSALSSLRPRPRLHLLGTGNPLSLLMFAACGADSFDGLEWCQTCADHTDGRLHHFQHFDFFAYQTAPGADSAVSFGSAALYHNLLFFADWMREISDALAQGRTRTLLGRHLPAGALEDFEARRPETFSWR